MLPNVTFGVGTTNKHHYNHSKQETDVLEHQIKDVAEAISQSDYGAGIRIAVEAARGVIEASSDTQVVSDDALEILDDIRNSAIRLDSVQKAEAAYSSYSNSDKNVFPHIY